MQPEKNTRNEKTAKILYICLAVVIVAVMTVSVFAAVSKKKNKVVTPEPEVTTGYTAQLPPETKPQETARETVPPVVTKAPETKAPETDPTTEPADVTIPTETPVIAERSYIAPVSGDVVKDYSMDMPVYSSTMNDYRTHNGIDISAQPGDPVFAFTDGVIKEVYADPMMGTTVKIDHGDGLVSVYQNLQSAVLEGITVGKEVKAGELIGAVGETALIECAESSHLHFCVMKDGAYVSPTSYLGDLIPTLAQTGEFEG